MTAALRSKLDGLTFKNTELTVGEAVLAQRVHKDNDVASLLSFVAARVEHNQDYVKLKPSELFECPLSELVQLVNTRVIPGIKGTTAAFVTGLTATFH